MTWASALVGVCVAMILFAALVFVAVLFSKTLSRVVEHADRSHDRVVKLHQDLLDRVMAGDFAVFKAHKMAEDAPEGAWEPPDRLDPLTFAQKLTEESITYDSTHQSIS